MPLSFIVETSGPGASQEYYVEHTNVLLDAVAFWLYFEEKNSLDTMALRRL